MRSLYVRVRTLTNSEWKDAKKCRVLEGRTDEDGTEYWAVSTAVLFIWPPLNARSNVFIIKGKKTRAETSMWLYKHYLQI